MNYFSKKNLSFIYIELFLILKIFQLNMLKNVIDFQISSDPKLGALNKSSDGSTFTIRLDENGLCVPKKAYACTIFK